MNDTNNPAGPPRFVEGLHLVPMYMRGGIKRYIEDGEIPGDFLYAVLTNNFMKAVVHADDVNRDRLIDYAKFLYNYAPAFCFGSVDKVRFWSEYGGLSGGAGQKIREAWAEGRVNFDSVS